MKFSRGLEWITLIERKSFLPCLIVKIAPIQPLRWNAVLSGNTVGLCRSSTSWGAPPIPFLMLSYKLLYESNYYVYE